MVESLPELAPLLRERQTLVTESSKLDWTVVSVNERFEVLDVPDGPMRDRLAAIDARLEVIDRQLTRAGYNILASPEPVSADQVQNWLRDGEALVLLNHTGETTYLWVITKEVVRPVRTDLGGGLAITREVGALRCGLDYSQWTEVSHWPGESDADKRENNQQIARLQRCRSQYADPPRSTQDEAIVSSLPFDLARSYALYKALFGKVEDLIKDKHLLIVASGALTALPFQVLVTEKPRKAFVDTVDDYATVAWLGARNTLTVLPAVSNLKAARVLAVPSRATEPFIGFGNPLLSGISGADTAAWKRTKCAAPPVARRVRPTAPPPRTRLAFIDRGALANVENVRHQPSLPETADELCAVARALGVDELDRAVNLGRRATEARVKALSADGTLARTRVVHFATHGLMASETAHFAVIAAWSPHSS